MASEFIGYTIIVTLKSPPPTQHLQGVVADVVEQQLVLKNGRAIHSSDTKTNITKSLFCGMANTFHRTTSILQPLRTLKL